MKQLDLLVRGDVVLPNRVLRDGALGILDGRIVTVNAADDAKIEAREVIEASGALILPGVVDTHVHCLSSAEEGIERATAAAAAGGVTTIVDMPYDAENPIFDAERLAAKIQAVSAQAHVDVGLYGSMAKENGLDAVLPQLEAGVLAFKFSLFETNPLRFPRINDGDLEAVFELLAPSGIPIVLHCELQEIIERRLRQTPAAAHGRPEAHAESRPPVSETGAIAKALELALWTSARVHIAHVTHPHGFELIEWYRSLGARVSGETCVHYLALSDADVARLGPTAKVNPPIREALSREGLWDALRNGLIKTVSTDHAPWPIELKERPMLAAASGMAGLETILPLMHTEARARGHELPAIVELLAGTPAELFGLAGRKGRLLPDYDADFVIFDPEVSWTFNAARSFSSARHSPFDARPLVGRVRATYLRGEPVYRDGELLAVPGTGRWLRRNEVPTRGGTSE